ncbi:(d)CMP kinase [Nitrospirillum sp. BR 11828]|uniref:(d)CMP kinase n=1 Tax=Nitrospirillum sp. BR 11828 TaxID=3104325 RepID=UPI002ACA4FBB|nr:(d)CMP kinase [Nitrospirillum sp. BR 11828]MDZ5647002.1 (d)CMP kinase [Nitrospirillum sp. BR 11828]
MIPSPSFIVAIDGPAASGKGTLARRLAGTLGFAHLDTGALYRAVGLSLLRAGHAPDDGAAAIAAARGLDAATVLPLMNDPALRQDAVAVAASKVSVVPEVRAALLDFQRDFANHPPGGAKGAVLDGRDVGTVVCPQAPAKLFVTADVEVRARRRLSELRNTGAEAIYDAVLEDMKVRDARDSQRAVAPLKPAVDAFLLDTSMMDADQAFIAAMDFIRSRPAFPDFL